MYTRFFKRVIDIVLSVIGIIICLIPMIITAIAIKIDSPGPVLFRQKRIGYKGKVFEIYKFRSMCQGAEHTGTGVYSGADDMRVTRVGKIIRATSIDELPQLFNIIKGDMSFIGPRPPLTYHPWPIEEYTEEQLHMFDARPGITGWAQVTGFRGETKELYLMEGRVEADIWYMEHWSFLLDLLIIYKTFANVIIGEKNAY
jgi:lipopolysaccharide/colanic/teichoic acid biosynthesis glycosyltransferase